MEEINIEKFDDLSIKIDTDDYQYLNDLKEYFTDYVPNFQFMPQYQCGGWNGKTSMLNPMDKSLPFGLFMDFLKFHNKYYPFKKLNIEKDVKNIFKGCEPDFKWDLELKPYDFQEECIKAALKYSKGIIRSATASGKSLMITYIIKTLKEKGCLGKCIIIVPSLSLIEQFVGDIKDYGFEIDIGKVNSKKKEWDKTLVISTWQTLAKNHDVLNNYNTVIVDEVHGAKAHELKKILSNCTRAKYRLGFTGTLPTAKVDLWNIKSFLGPVIKDYPAGYLADKGYIAKCNVNMLYINYNTGYNGFYDDIKDNLFRNPYRLEVLDNIIRMLENKGNALILVGKVEKEGEFLEEYLKTSKNEKKLAFLSGKDDVSRREKWRRRCNYGKGICLIATYGIFQAGINIPSLKYIIMASPFKSKIRVLQSIGRSLRKHASKANGAQIFDLVDETKYFSDHGSKRLRYYNSEKFDVNEILLEEGNPIQIDNI
jgi:superfamily II DNA or RNA helicase